MPFSPVPGVAQFSIKAMWNGVIDMTTVWHVERLGDGIAEPWTSQQLLFAANRVAGAWSTILVNVSGAYVAEEVIGRDLSSVDGSYASLPVANVGGFAGNAQTGPYEGPMVSWLTGVAGRHNGRTFVPGIPESSIDANGMIAGANVAALQGQAEQALAFLRAPSDATHQGVPLDLVVVSARPVGAALTRVARPVIGVRVRSDVAIQRRRRIRG
jgi:hypothetical protein